MADLLQVTVDFERSHLIFPRLIGFILGPGAEIYFVKSLESFGTLGIFFTKSWIAILLWVLIAGSVIGSAMLARRKTRALAAEAQD